MRFANGSSSARFNAVPGGTHLHVREAECVECRAYFLGIAKVLIAVRQRIVRIEQCPLGQELRPELGIRVVVVDDGRHPREVPPQATEASPTMPERAMNREQGPSNA